MSDFSEVTQISFFSRIKDAFVGLVFGGLLFAAAFVLLFWNEGRAIKTMKSLEEGAGAVVSAGIDRVDPANEGRLVHVSGDAATAEALQDAAFGLSAHALRLRRKVAMYQWTENSQTQTEKQIGGGEVKKTVYSYKQGWSDRAVDSHAFHQAGHDNPSALPYNSQDWTASKATLGAFILSNSLIQQMDAFQPLAVLPSSLPAELSAKLKPAEGSFFQGADPANPQVGDVRVSFLTVAPQTVSVVSKQLGATFEPYATKAGRNIDILVLGAHGADEMFKSAMANNQAMTWALRAGGFVMMFIGLVLLFRPLDVLADVLPFLGWIVTAGTTMLSFVFAAALSLATVAVAWIAYRPLIGGALLVGAIAFFVKGMSHKSAAAPTQAIPA